MKRLLPLLVMILALTLIGLGCQVTSPTPERIVETVVVTVEMSATPRLITPTPAVPSELSATPEPDAPPDEPTPTKTLPPIQATMQALREQAGTPSGSGGPTVDTDDYPALFEIAWEIVNENYVRGNFNGVDWDAVHEEYQARVQEVESQPEFWSLMEDMIRELNDDHSRFVRPDRFASEFNLPSDEAGRPWPGFTVWPAREDEYLLLWNVCELGPAAEAGLERGDVILAVDGEPVEPGFSSFEEVRQQLYDGDEVTLTVQQGPDEQPREVTVPFGGAAGCDGWSYGVLSDDPYVGYIRIPNFSGNADTNLLEAIRLLEEQRPLDGLVLDVRHNPGGNADRSTAIFTQGTFGTVGKLREGASQGIFRIRGPVKWNETTPLALLTDGSSHSAAEYFATALQQAGRAVLVGMPTAGNTEGITGFGLPDGSLVRLAVETLILPDGSTLEGTGVIPDIQVPLGQWGLKQQPDVQLQSAYQAVLDQIQE